MCQICTHGWQGWCTVVVLMIMELFSKVQPNLVIPKKKNDMLMIMHRKNCKENFRICIQDAKFWARSGFRQNSNSVFRTDDKHRITWCTQAWRNARRLIRVPYASMLAASLYSKNNISVSIITGLQKAW